MVYVLWFGVGVLFGLLFGAGPRRRALSPHQGGSLLAGGFGGLIGGVIGDGFPAALAGEITVSSMVGALVGSAILTWAVRPQATDMEP